MGNQIMMMGILMIYGKNYDVQKSMLEILKADEKNIILTKL